MTYLTRNFNSPATQRETILGRENEMVTNNAGGAVFPVTDDVRLDRFLILGTEGGTFYANERTLTKENTAEVLRMVKEDGLKVVQRVVELAHKRAPKIGPSLFTLALCGAYGDEATKNAAFEALRTVARTASQLFQFIEYIDSMRGWGRSLKRGVAQWYTERSVSNLAYQTVKYRNRNGWTHRDVLRKVHPVSYDHNNLFAYLTDKEHSIELPGMEIVKSYETLKNMELKKIPSYIKEHPNVTWELLPTDALKEKEVWQALLPNLPATALLRNLGRLSALKVLTPMSDETLEVQRKLSREDYVKEAGYHPLAVLLALQTYRSGHGFRGNMSWSPVATICDSLEQAFVHSFHNAPTTGKRYYMGLDVSGSMGMQIMNTSITAAQATGALAMITARKEEQYHMAAFAGTRNYSSFRSYTSNVNTMLEVPITASTSLSNIVETMAKITMGNTDCSLPMLDAKEKNIPVDVFVILTDNETWAGRVHPTVALQQYREATGIPAKCVVVGMTATNFTIADPEDAGMMDIVGFDAAMHSLIADFATS